MATLQLDLFDGDYKTCRDCGLRKHLSGFAKEKRNSFRVICRICANNISKTKRQQSREEANEKSRIYKSKNKERIAKHRRKRYQNNKKKVRSEIKAWEDKNPGARARFQAARKATLIRATPIWADQEKIKQIYFHAALMSRERGIQYDVDHVVPLKGKMVCGLHVHYNLQILTHEENCSKNNRFDPEKY